MTSRRKSIIKAISQFVWDSRQLQKQNFGNWQLFLPLFRYFMVDWHSWNPYLEADNVDEYSTLVGWWMWFMKKLSRY